VQDPSAAHGAAQRAQPQHQAQQPAAPRQLQPSAAQQQQQQQRAPSVGTAGRQHQQQRPSQQRPGGFRAASDQHQGLNARPGGRGASSNVPGGGSGPNDTSTQQRRPTAQRSVKRRDAGTVERCTASLCTCSAPVHAGVTVTRSHACLTSSVHGMEIHRVVFLIKKCSPGEVMRACTTSPGLGMQV
jgi:hypothetical protein